MAGSFSKQHSIQMNWLEIIKKIIQSKWIGWKFFETKSNPNELAGNYQKNNPIQMDWMELFSKQNPIQMDWNKIAHNNFNPNLARNCQKIHNPLPD